MLILHILEHIHAIVIGKLFQNFALLAGLEMVKRLLHERIWDFGQDLGKGLGGKSAGKPRLSLAGEVLVDRGQVGVVNLFGH